MKTLVTCLTVSGWWDNGKNAAAGASLVGFFNCQGEMSRELADILVKSGDPEAAVWGKAREKTLGQPDAARLERARAFAREVMAEMSQRHTTTPVTA